MSSQKSETLRLIGKSEPMLQLFKMIGRVCNTGCAVLLIGEKGSGKSRVARAIHDCSRNAATPFHTLSGKLMREASDEDLLSITESHQADATIYITDFASMPAYVQDRLVDIRKTGRYKCSHTAEERDHRLRFIVATEGDIREGIERGRVPADLFYDWNFLPLIVPPLRDRKEDIPPLANHFLEILSKEMRISRKELSPEAVEKLVAHEWPGNLTELSQCMQTALVNCRGNYIRAEHLAELKTGGGSESLLHLKVFLSSRLSSYIEGAPSGVSGNLFRLLLPEMEQSLFQYALKKSRGNRNRAALHLGLHRNTLNKKLQNPG